VETFLKYLSWPVAVIIIVILLALIFRKPLMLAIERGGLKIGKEGLSIDPLRLLPSLCNQNHRPSTMR
jgi:galactitol-specific phosphotransferase system IIC component